MSTSITLKNRSVETESVYVVELDDRASAEALTFSELIATEYGSVENDRFRDESTVLAHELPRSLRMNINDFRIREPASVCAVRGYHIEDDRLGDTPRHWRDVNCPGASNPSEFFFFLCCALLGDPVAWATKQDARLVHDIVPTPGQEREQLASSSSTALTWHTEDSFHPLRADYVALMCLRNPDFVRTTFASVDDFSLSAETTRSLMEPKFTFIPDGSHLVPPSDAVRDKVPTELLERSRARIVALNAEPQEVPILFGHPERPYLRLDEHFSAPLDGDQEGCRAFEEVCAAVTANLTGIVLAPGDVCFIDNFKAVHGREAFAARFDGTDRWLKRINVTRNLRTSRASRASAESRIIV